MNSKITPKKTPEGFCYLNAGCGDHFFQEWNNIDLIDQQGVIYYDIRKSLPYPDCSFDCVYASHVLEHLTLKEGEHFLNEVYRTLKSNGIVRIVVPDLEQICRLYLDLLNIIDTDPSPRNLQRYHWIKLELIDQMVRHKTGGLMVETIEAGNYDPDFLESRSGDSFITHQRRKNMTFAEKWTNLQGTPWHIRIRILRAALERRLRSRLGIYADPRKTGEAHRWMYDRVSLKIALKNAGFAKFRLLTYDRSHIPFWDKYNLDRSIYKEYDRKPGSLYTEAQKPD